MYGGQYLASLREGESVLRQICREEGYPENFRFVEVPGGGHRSYHLSGQALLWLHEHLGMLPRTREKLLAMEEIRFGDWCAAHGFSLPDTEELYWPERHYTGAVFADSGVRPMSPDQLHCLRREEIGDPRFTLEGWLDRL